MEHVSEELQQWVELLVIDTGIMGHHTVPEFKEAKMDKDYFWTISFKVRDLPKLLKMNYVCHIILSPKSYNVSLRSEYENIKKPQQVLKDTDETFVKRMAGIHNQYMRDRKAAGEYEFNGRVTEMKDSNNRTLKFSIDSEVVMRLEKMAKEWKNLNDYILVLEEI